MFELCSIHPRLFAATVIIDPIIGPASLHSGLNLIYASTMRTDVWQSRKEAERVFKSAKPLKRWDSRVMDLWLQYGLRDTPSRSHPEPGKVTLRTTKAHEAWSYARPWFEPLPESYLSEKGRAKYPDGDESIFQFHPFYRSEVMNVWEALPQIRQPVLYIFPGSGPMSTEVITAEKVAQTGSGPRGSGGEKFGMTSKTVIPQMWTSGSVREAQRMRGGCNGLAGDKLEGLGRAERVRTREQG